MSLTSLSRRSLMAVAASFSLAGAPAIAQTAAAPKVLMVVSGHGQDAGKTRPGFELDEFAVAYMVFKANGLQVEVASPQGGKVEPDKFNPKRDQIVAFHADPAAAKLFDNTLRIADLKPGAYQAVFVAGGKGAMFDLAQNAPLGDLLAKWYEQGGVVSAVCHGVAALSTAKLTGGEFIAKGKRVTGFTNEEEAEFGKRWAKQFPYLLEDKLREQGARWEEAGIMLPHTVADGRLITGQNPFSTGDTAEHVVRALGKKPVARAPFQDEATMKLGAQFFSGERQAASQAFQADPKRFHIEFLGYLAHLHGKTAETDAKRRDALALMQLTEPHFAEPQMQVSMAQLQIKLGDREAAKKRLTAVLEKSPDLRIAKETMASL